MSALRFITQGVIAKINGGISTQQDLGGLLFIVQVSDFEPISQNKRYRVLMSDGTDTMIAIISSLLVGMIEDKEIIEHSIIKINQFVVTIHNAVRGILVSDLTVIATAALPLLGVTPVISPQMLNTTANQTKPASNAAQAYSAHASSSVSEPAMSNDPMSGNSPIKAISAWSDDELFDDDSGSEAKYCYTELVRRSTRISWKNEELNNSQRVELRQFTEPEENILDSQMQQLMAATGDSLLDSDYSMSSESDDSDSESDDSDSESDDSPCESEDESDDDSDEEQYDTGTLIDPDTLECIPESCHWTLNERDQRLFGGHKDEGEEDEDEEEEEDEDEEDGDYHRVVSKVVIEELAPWDLIRDDDSLYETSILPDPLYCMVAEISRDFKTDLLWSDGSLALLHAAAESYMEIIFRNAAIVAGSAAVEPSHMRSAVSLYKLNNIQELPLRGVILKRDYEKAQDFQRDERMKNKNARLKQALECRNKMHQHSMSQLQERLELLERQIIEQDDSYSQLHDRQESSIKELKDSNFQLEERLEEVHASLRGAEAARNAAERERNYAEAANIDNKRKRDCPICLARPFDVRLNNCGHVLCTQCVDGMLELDRKNCPMCAAQYCPVESKKQKIFC